MRSHQKVTLALALLAATAASAATIPLRAGDYGDATLACTAQLNASILSFDGRSFGYPHAAGCTDRVTGRAAGVLSVTETCRADGDGSPAAPTTQAFKLRVLAPDRFELITDDRRAAYRRCGERGFFDEH